MKLLTVLMLIALPLSCFAGSGCPLFDKVLDDILSLDVSVDQYIKNLEKFLYTDSARRALPKLKECFLNQDEDTLANVQKMMDIIYGSTQCSKY